METENESFSSSAHVVRTTAKHVISRRGNNENSCEMLENEKKYYVERAKLLFLVKYANLRCSCRRRGCLMGEFKQPRRLRQIKRHLK